MEDFALSVRKRKLQIRAHEVYEINHIADVSEAVGSANDKLDLVVGSLNSCIAYVQPDRVENVLAVATDLARQIADGRDAAMACPPEPGLQLLLGFLYVIQLQKQSQRFLDPVGAIQPRVLLSYHLQTNPLVVREILWRFTESIGGPLDFSRFPLGGREHGG